MALKTHWNDDEAKKIWIIEYAGRMTIEDHQQAHAATNAVIGNGSVCILIDMTEVMYSGENLNDVWQQVTTNPEIDMLDDFLDSPNVPHVGIVIPGSVSTPLRQTTLARQEQKGRLEKTGFFKAREDALAYLVPRCTSA